MKIKLVEVLVAVVMTLVLQACSKQSEDVQSLEALEPEQQPVVSIEPVLVSPVVDEQPVASILDRMQLEIAPATDILWSVDDPQTDEQWSVLEQAAVEMIGLAQKTALGGSGPRDLEWSSNPSYQVMNQLMLDAAKASLTAIQARDLDALFEAGDQLYAPCEACHLQFNPGVAGQ